METANNGYIISGGKDGKARLSVLSEVLYTSTRSLLGAQGVEKGISFLDLGCGGGNVALMVAQMVGDTGSVTAVDFDKDIIALARQDAADSNTTNISFEANGAYDISYNNEFDIAYARFLLSHLTQPLTALKNMVQAVKPGGKIIVEDIHFSGHFCHPACNAFNKYVQYFTAAAQSNGHNAEIGPYLLDLFRQAGISNIGFEVINPTFTTGKGKWMAYITLDKIKNTLADKGIASMPEIENMLAELETFANDAQTIMSMPRIFRVWGEKAVK